MKLIYFFLFFGLVQTASYSQDANLTNPWVLTKYHLYNGTDTVYYFDKYKKIGLWNLSNISCFFEPGNTYKGRTLTGKVKPGTWYLSGNRFIMDTDTLEIVSLTSKRFVLRKFVSTVYEGTTVSSYLYSEFESIIESITSGSWNNPDTWSCNCIPQSTHNVVIKSGHNVQLARNESGACKNFYTEPGAIFDGSPTAFSAKPSN